MKTLSIILLVLLLFCVVPSVRAYSTSPQIFQIVDAGFVKASTNSVTLPVPVNQYDILVDAVFLHPTNLGKTLTPTDNNSLVWTKVTSCGSVFNMHSHEIDIYVANMTHTTDIVTITQTTNVTMDYDFKVTELSRISITTPIVVCNSGSTIFTDVPNTVMPSGYAVLDFSMFMYVGSSTHTWNASTPLTVNGFPIDTMVTKGTIISGDSHYANEAYYYSLGQTTNATWTPSGTIASEGVWSNILIGFRPSDSSLLKTSLDVTSMLFLFGVSITLTLLGRIDRRDLDLFYLLSVIWCMFSLGYVLVNYSSVGIPMLLFLVSYLIVGFLFPVVLWIRKVV